MPSRVFSFLHRRWRLLLAAPVAAAIAAYVVTRAATPLYEASATLLITPAPATADPAASMTEPANTYARLALQPAVLESMRQRLGLSTLGGDLAGKLAVAPVTGTLLLRITATDADPDLAASLATAAARAYQDVEAERSGAGTLTLVEPATTPRRATTPDARLTVLAGLFLGLFGATGLALALDRFTVARSRRSRSASANRISSALRSATGTPVLQEPVGPPADRDILWQLVSAPGFGTEVAPQASAPGRPYRIPGTTTPTTLSDSGRGTFGLQGSFLKDEGLRPTPSTLDARIDAARTALQSQSPRALSEPNEASMFRSEDAPEPSLVTTSAQAHALDDAYRAIDELIAESRRRRMDDPLEHASASRPSDVVSSAPTVGPADRLAARLEPRTSAGSLALDAESPARDGIAHASAANVLGAAGMDSDALSSQEREIDELIAQSRAFRSQFGRAESSPPATPATNSSQPASTPGAARVHRPAGLATTPAASEPARPSSNDARVDEDFPGAHGTSRPDQLDATMSELLCNLDQTINLIRSLRPPDKTRDRRGL